MFNTSEMISCLKIALSLASVNGLTVARSLTSYSDGCSSHSKICYAYFRRLIVIQFWQLALSFFDQTDRASSLHINRELGSSKFFGSHDKIVFMCQFATPANESIIVVINYRCHAMLLLLYDQKAMKIKSKSGKVL